ncbi:SsrA-binding protein, partial [archaeon]
HAREVPAPKRRRKLLLKKREIKRLIGKVQEKGLTLIPVSIYFNERGWAKLKIGVARGRRKHEKKEVLKQRDIEREVERELKRW